MREIILEWLADVDDALEDDPGSHDAYVRLGARWVEGNYQERLQQAYQPAPPDPPEPETTKAEWRRVFGGGIFCPCCGVDVAARYGSRLHKWDCKVKKFQAQVSLYEKAP